MSENTTHHLQKRSDEEIAKEKAEKIKELEGVELKDVLQDSTTKGSRYYARKFKELYTGVRKGLVHLQKKRTLGMISNEEAYEEALMLLGLFNKSE